MKITFCSISHCACNATKTELELVINNQCNNSVAGCMCNDTTGLVYSITTNDRLFI